MELMRGIDATLLDETGLPGRGWYKNMIYAPGRYVGYGVTTLPGVSEAITEEREEDENIWGSMIKQAIKRRNPGFNERAFGFRSFNDLLLEGQKRGQLKLEADEKSGGYRVRLGGA